jgi:hypothetical protein
MLRLNEIWQQPDVVSERCLQGIYKSKNKGAKQKSFAPFLSHAPLTSLINGLIFC